MGASYISIHCFRRLLLNVFWEVSSTIWVHLETTPRALTPHLSFKRDGGVSVGPITLSNGFGDGEKTKSEPTRSPLPHLYSILSHQPGLHEHSAIAQEFGFALPTRGEYEKNKITAQ